MDGWRQWQLECEYIGRHTQFVPAEFAYGYQWRPYATYAMPIVNTLQYRPTPQVNQWFTKQNGKRGFRFVRIRREGRW